ncbi:MAG: SpoIIE family protein phosphatase [Bacteroidia bacterium]|nr:SpoIIE family protein phosphatase [Bacteroidia bacterium]
MKQTSISCILLLIFIIQATFVVSQNSNIDSCINVLKTAKEDTNKVILLNDIAWDISYTNLQKGIDYSDQAYTLAKRLNYERSFSRICNTQGAIYSDMAETAKALTLFFDGLKYAKKYHQVGVEVALYNSLGNLYNKSDGTQKALYYYLLSVETSLKNGNKKPPVVAYSNISGIYAANGKLDSAMYYVNLCVDYNLKINDKTGLANNYITLSEIYTVLNNKIKCLVFAQKAFEAAKEANDLYTLSHTCVQLSDAFYFNNNIQFAINALDDAKIYASKTGDIPVLELSAANLSSYYEELGDFKNGLKYFKEYKLYKDSALNNESIQQFKNAEAKYENDKKQKEIELLASKQKLNEEQNQKKKIYLTVSLIGIVILVFVLIVLYRNNVLKQKTNRNLEAFNREINHQKELVEVKNKEITDSINYAKRIQQSILTSDAYFKKYTADFFILFKPKDIVSGDFYWALNHEGKFIVMTADCTGHGVPGAMMSMMGINFLNEIVNEKKISNPAHILNQLRTDIIKALNPEGSLIETKDGMDCCLCSFDFKQMKLRYANANNNFYIIRNKELIVSKSNKMPVGAGHNANELFVEYEMDIQKNDLVISFTDGYADQFGGDKGKKFKYKQLEELLYSSAHLPLSTIKEKLNDTIEYWKGDLEQVDDICVIGIKV